VPTTSGTLMPPSAVHDPRNADLVALLDAGSAFPAGAFAADPQVCLAYNISDLPVIRRHRHESGLSITQPKRRAVLTDE